MTDDTGEKILVPARRTGKTKAMLESIDANKETVVVVHNYSMLSYFTSMLRSLRPELKDKVDIVVISSADDAWKLRGQNKPIYVDHAAKEHLNYSTWDVLDHFTKYSEKFR